MIHINLEEKLLVDSETGKVLRPACWNDLIPYHSYFVGRGYAEYAQIVLQRVFDGELVISNMIAYSQKPQDTNK